jgi:hypothetical protein
MHNIKAALRVLSLASIIFALLATLSVADIYHGAWYATQYGFQVVLNEDGTYIFAASTGTYIIQNGVISFQDQQGGMPTSYYITGQGDQMRFVDQFGVPIDMVRRAEYREGVLATANTYEFTDEDLEGYLNYYSFMMELYFGAPFAWDESYKTQVGQSIVQTFMVLPPEQQQMYATMSELWPIIQEFWADASDSLKQEYISVLGQSYAQQQQMGQQQYYQGTDQYQATGGYDYSNAGFGNAQNYMNSDYQPTQSDLSQQMYDMQMEQQNFNMMNNMMMMDHATSLNIIENFKPVPEYNYEVIDYNY